MLSYLMYAVCFLLILQGAGNFQYMLSVTQPFKWRTAVIWIGSLSLVVSVVMAIVLAAQWTFEAARFGNVFAR